MEKFAEIVERVQRIASDFSERDLCDTLFALQLWLPNISAVYRIEVIWASFLGCKADALQRQDQVNGFADFQTLTQLLIAAVPTEASIEDFVPETDWGEVRITLEAKHYRILYGGGSAYPYDYAEAFRILHFPFERDYVEALARSPKEEFREKLEFLDRLVGQVDAHPPRPIQINPGNLETPTEEFWSQSLAFLKTLRSEGPRPGYSGASRIRVGDLPAEVLQERTFFERFANGTTIRADFVESSFGKTPILPRNLIHNLFNQWGQHFGQLPRRAQAEGERKITFALGEYLSRRFPDTQVLPWVQTVASGPMFHLALSGADSMLFIRLESPLAPVDLSDTTQAIADTVHALTENPHQLLVMGEDAWQSSGAGTAVTPPRYQFFSVVLQLSSESLGVQIPQGFGGKLLFLIDFLMVMDSADDLPELLEFLDFQKAYSAKVPRALLSDFDMFAAFRQSAGVLTTGGLDYHSIFLDPHGGSNFRFAALEEFYESFPLLDSFPDPRLWDIMESEDGLVGLASRGERVVAHVAFRDHRALIIRFAFAEAKSATEAQVLNMMAQCLAHNANRYSALFFDLPVFRDEGEVNVTLQRHEEVSSTAWSWNQLSNKSFHLICNVDACSDAFLNPKDRSTETSFLLSFIHQTTALSSEKDHLVAAVNADSTGAPGFKVYEAAPQHDIPTTPLRDFGASDSRMGTKLLAQACVSAQVEPGLYQGARAVTILNAIRKAAIRAMESMLLSLPFEQSLEATIIAIEALSSKYWRARSRIEAAENQEINYDRISTLQSKRSEHTRLHQAARYLLCKIVQLQPEPRGSPSAPDSKAEETVRTCIAFAAEIVHLCQLSDELHYGELFGHSIQVESDYEVRAILSEPVRESVDRFNLKQIQDRLKRGKRHFEPGAIIGDLDRFREDLDSASMADFGFSFSAMISCLDALRFWSSRNGESTLSGFICAPRTEVTHFLADAAGLDESTSRKILEFLLLLPSEVCLTFSGSGTFRHDDVPIWEHAKRFARPEIRPLFLIADNVSFGPSMVYDAMRVWLGHIANFTLPFEARGSAVSPVLMQMEKRLHKQLVDATESIVKQRAIKVRRELELHRVCGTDDDIGDVDILAYHNETIWNIECKFYRGSYCIKDAARDKKKTFTDRERERSYVAKVEVREDYIRRHADELLTALGWEREKLAQPLIVRSVFVFNSHNFWLLNPPQATAIKFVQIEDLEDIFLPTAH